MAEQFALDQLARDRRHVDGNERAGPPFAVIVQSACDQFLAGAQFAIDHHRQVGRGEPGDGPIDLLHRRAAADQRQLLVCVARFRGARAGRRRNRQRPTDDRQQFLQIKWLGQVFEGAALGRLHRRHQRRLRAHDHDPQIGAELADARDRSRPFSSGITTSVMTRSPSPSSTHRHKVAALPVLRT